MTLNNPEPTRLDNNDNDADHSVESTSEQLPLFTWPQHINDLLDDIVDLHDFDLDLLANVYGEIDLHAPAPAAAETPSSLLIRVLHTPLPAWATSHARQLAQEAIARTGAPYEHDNEAAETLYRLCANTYPDQCRDERMAFIGAALRYITKRPILMRPGSYKTSSAYSHLPQHHSTWQPRALYSGRFTATVTGTYELPPEQLPPPIHDLLFKPADPNEATPDD